MEGQANSTVDERGYDVFISFVTDPDYKAARIVRDFLESFAQRVKRSGFKIPPVRAFVDSDNLSRRSSEATDTPDLGNALRGELLRSRHLLILCSQSTPHSKWVQREFEWYSQARDTDAVLLAVTDPVDPVAEPQTVFPGFVLDLGLENRL